MELPNINFDLDMSIFDLATEMNGDECIVANAAKIINFTLPDGREVQVQVILQTDESEFID